jgi:hypothetical protein
MRVRCRFANSAASAIGGLLFLRLICPALTAANDNGLLGVSSTPAVAAATQRSLLTVSKLLQTLANQVIARSEAT